MPASGHEPPRRKFSGAAAMPSIADTKAVGRRGRSGPKADKCGAAKSKLFDRLIGGGKLALFVSGDAIPGRSHV